MSSFICDKCGTEIIDRRELKKLQEVAFRQRFDDGDEPDEDRFWNRRSKR